MYVCVCVCEREREKGETEIENRHCVWVLVKGTESGITYLDALIQRGLTLRILWVSLLPTTHLIHLVWNIES